MENIEPPFGGRNDFGSALDSFSIAHRLAFNGGFVEVADYTYRRPTNDLATFGDYFLNFAVNPRPAPAWAVYEDRPRVSERIGRILFVPAGHTVRSGSMASCGKQRTLTCALSAEMFERILPTSPAWDDAALAESLHLGGPDIEWLLFKIYRELRQGGFGTELVVESLATALAVALIRKLGLEQGGARPLRSGGMAPWRMRRIRDRVHAEAPAPGLGELADLCGVSVRHLSRAFKAETGQTIAEYVQQATIERARIMLSESDTPICEIARILGFASSTSFAYAFRRATGVRPSEIEGRRRARPSAAPAPDGGERRARSKAKRSAG
jgi:AraC family transcriptional regulator